MMRSAPPPTYREALHRAFSLLSERHYNPTIAKWLLEYIWPVSREEWPFYLDNRMPEREWHTYVEWVERVTADEPYQYIIGEQDFYGRPFHVSPAVLIPRPETELLVEQVIRVQEVLWNPNGHQGYGHNHPDEDPPITGVDVGTGSGIIAITLALECAHLSMCAVDISVDALEIARKNGDRHGVDVCFIQSDLLDELMNKGKHVDMIVSNPPYIRRADHGSLARNVRQFEPRQALIAGDDGLYYYKRILAQSMSVLNRPGVLAFEVGLGQAHDVQRLILHHYPQASCHIYTDFNHIERMVIATVGE